MSNHRPPKRFLLFSALRMASPETVILLTVNYYAAIGWQYAGAVLAIMALNF